MVGSSLASTMIRFSSMFSMFIESQRKEWYQGWLSGSVERGASMKSQPVFFSFSGQAFIGRSGFTSASPGRSGTKVASMWMAR